MAMMLLQLRLPGGKCGLVSAHVSMHTALRLSSLFLLLSVTFFGRSAAASCQQLHTCSSPTTSVSHPAAVSPSAMTDSRSDACPEKIGDVSQLKCAFKLFDADFFPDSKVQEIAEGAVDYNIPIIRANRKSVASVDGGLQNPSPLVFNAKWGNASEQVNIKSRRFDYPSPSGIQRPKNDEDIAFMSVVGLGELIRTGQITSEELTRIFLQRLKRYGDVLQSVVSYTEELAFMQAKEADRLLAEGTYLGPLHGIPYGLKDIIAVPHYRTTWGSKTFKDQVLDIEAWVYKRLKSAGAVLVAKLATGSLAYDDIWFGGRTRNPWNIEEFSTGSSAGPAACTSA
ncbi:hypothetical protein CRG98_019440, partial [Punica granatum]